MSYLLLHWPKVVELMPKMGDSLTCQRDCAWGTNWCGVVLCVCARLVCCVCATTVCEGEGEAVCV